jgi:hypothetical protein
LIQLHGVVGGVLESLLQVSNLTGQFTLGRFISCISLLNLREIL